MNAIRALFGAVQQLFADPEPVDQWNPPKKADTADPEPADPEPADPEPVDHEDPEPVNLAEEGTRQHSLEQLRVILWKLDRARRRLCAAADKRHLSDEEWRINLYRPKSVHETAVTRATLAEEQAGKHLLAVYTEWAYHMDKNGLDDSDINRIRYPPGTRCVPTNAPEYMEFAMAMARFDRYGSMLADHAFATLHYFRKSDWVACWETHVSTLATVRCKLDAAIARAYMLKLVLRRTLPAFIVDYILEFAF